MNRIACTMNMTSKGKSSCVLDILTLQCGSIYDVIGLPQCACVPRNIDPSGAMCNFSKNRTGLGLNTQASSGSAGGSV